MKLYINGDSHTAAAEAVVPHAFAEDDSRLAYLGRGPHPSNISVSWGKVLADTIKAVFHCDAESASSNARIIRTTREWVTANRAWLPETLIIIQWSTWEREEWIIDGQKYQVTGSGTDDVPAEHADRYKQWVTDLDWAQVILQAHEDIWNFHQELNALGARHVFFNGNNHFEFVPKKQRYKWGISYIDPYSPEMTYNQWLRNQGFSTVSPKSWHFGADAHSSWSRFMLQYVIKNQLLV